MARSTTITCPWTIHGTNKREFAYILFSADVSESFSQTWVFFFIGNAGPEDHDGREPWGQVW